MIKLISLITIFSSFSVSAFAMEQASENNEIKAVEFVGKCTMESYSELSDSKVIETTPDLSFSSSFPSQIGETSESCTPKCNYSPRHNFSNGIALLVGACSCADKNYLASVAILPAPYGFSVADTAEIDFKSSKNTELKSSIIHNTLPIILDGKKYYHVGVKCEVERK